MTRRYHRQHAWLEPLAPGLVRLGITAFAAGEIGEATQVGLPRAGQALTEDSALAEVESAKSVHELPAPCAGTVRRVNQALMEDPALLTRDPENAGWLVELQADLPPDTLAQAEYLALVRHGA